MPWAGPMTVFLLISASLIELDQENGSVQNLQDHGSSYNGDIQTSSLFVQLDKLKGVVANDSSNRIQPTFSHQLSGYTEEEVSSSLTLRFEKEASDGLKYIDTNETRPAGKDVCCGISLNDTKGLLECENQYNTEAVIMKKEQEMALDSVRGQKGDPILSLDQFTELDDFADENMIVVSNSTYGESGITCGNESVCTLNLNITNLDCEKYQTSSREPMAGSSGFTNSCFFSLTTNKSEYKDNSVVTNKSLSEVQIQKQDLFTDDCRDSGKPVHQQYSNANAFDDARKPEPEDDEFETEAKSHSLTEIVTSLVCDHIMEPLEQWWKDDWGKYLREYIRDMKWLLKAFSAFVKHAAEQILSITYRLCCLTSHLDKLSFDMIATTIQDLISWNKLFVDGVASTVSEVYHQDGKIHVAIRHFMHDKDYQFNYAWYCFYTIWNVINLVLMFKMLKKLMVHIFRVLDLVFRTFKKIFGRTNKVHISVGTNNPYDHLSMVPVQVDVFRSLVENSRTETKRLEHIRELEEQVAYAKKMAEWSDGWRAGLEEDIDRLSGDQSQRIGNINRVVESLNNIIEFHTDDNNEV